MNHKVQAYIDRINANDPTLREINLAFSNLDDANITALMTALASTPNVAQQITKLQLTYGQLTLINIPKTLVALRELYLGENQLTSISIPATLVALKELQVGRNQLTSINIPSELVALRDLYLVENQLTSINIPRELVALRWLSLEDNPPLTMATKIALEALRRTRGDNNFRLDYDNPVPAETQLTDDILNAHFKPMLRSHPGQIIAHLKKTSAVWLLSYLPSDVAVKIGEYVEPIAEVERALASMANLQDMFSRLPMLNLDNNDQLNTLNRYNETVLQGLIKKTKNYYANAFQSKAIVKLGLRLNKFNNQAEEVTSETGLFSYLLYPIIFIFNAFKFVAVAISNAMSKFIYGKPNSDVEKESQIAQTSLPVPAPENTRSCLQTFKSMLPCFTLACNRSNNTSADNIETQAQTHSSFLSSPAPGL